MPRPQHIRFARHWIKNGDAARAYLHAGYKPTTKNSLYVCSSRLLRHAQVQRIIRTSRRLMTRKHEITLESLLRDLAEDRALARETKQVSAAIAATQLSAKLVGLLIDRKESGQPGDFASAQTSDEVLDLVRKEHGDELADLLAAALGRREAETAADPGEIGAERDADATLN